MTRHSRLRLDDIVAARFMTVGRPRRLAGAALALAVVAALASPCSGGGAEDRRVDDLLARMTIEEKFGQLQQLGGDATTGGMRQGQDALVRRGLIGSFIDVRGARSSNEVQKLALDSSPLKVPILFGYDVVHGYRTIFPVPLGLASAWDPEAWERSAAVAAREASAAGVRWVFAPMVDVARDPRWGRIVEGAGEDPYLGSIMAAAQVRGFQGRDYGAPGRVVACAKHWVGYGAAEGGRDYNAAEVSERTLRGVYFPPFRAALDAGVGSFMTALNELNGVPATVNPFTLGQVLRQEWRFDGPVVADYQAVEQLIAHGVAADGMDAARIALDAGVDVEEQSDLFRVHGPGLVRSGRLSRARLDEAVRRVLRLKVRLGLFDNPFVDESVERSIILSPENLAAAREVAGRSLVLLRNEGDVLPLGAGVRSIAVIGPMADDSQVPIGPWFADGKGENTVTVLAGVRAKVAGRSDPVKVAYAKGSEAVGGSQDGFEEAVRVARESDVAILVVGEPSTQSGEATSLTSLDLPGRQLDLVKAVHATGKPTVVVLLNGRPMTIGWVADHVPSILEAWYPGTQAGHAVADALFGDVNPGGKLPVTFPRSVGQVPLYYNHMNTGRPPSAYKYTSKYVDIDNGPLYPFGFGLSYTRFRLKDLRLGETEIPVDGRLVASVEVENVGRRVGDEVVQLYLHDEVASVTRPVKELRGFRRVTLRPGESRTLRFAIGPEDLGFHDRDMRFVVEPGRFGVIVGTSSEGGLIATFDVVGRKPTAAR